MTVISPTCLKRVSNCVSSISITYSSSETLKAWRAAVKNLAKPEQMKAVEVQIQSMLTTPLSDDLPESFDEIFTQLPQLGDVADGAYSKKSSHELYESLGFPTDCIQGIANKRDKERVYSLWDKDVDSVAFWENPPKGRVEELKLTWHQDVGVHVAGISMCRRQPLFLFDAVGIGKTAQGAGAILLRPWLRSYFEKNGKLPPAMGECLFMFLLCD